MRHIIRALTIVVGASACAMESHMSPRTPAKMAELWQEPRDLAQRNLLVGEFPKTDAPDPADKFEVTGVKTSGTNYGYDVKDSKGREWSVKLGVESRVEVTVSRVLWAIGYHQPPVYYLPKWTRVEEGKSYAEGPARFRLEPKGLKKVGDWSWTENPFVGTRPLNGLQPIKSKQTETARRRGTWYATSARRSEGQAGSTRRRRTIPRASPGKVSSTGSKRIVCASAITAHGWTHACTLL
jgi:hypothetical protein